MKLILSVFIAVSILVTSCNLDSIKGSESIIEKDYDYKNFENIEVDNTFTVKIVQSNEYKIQLKCNENIEEYIVVEQEGNTLKLSFKGNDSFRNIECVATVYMPDLNEIESSGATKVNFLDFKTESLKIDLSGASKIYGNLTVHELEIETSGASNISLTGDVEHGVLSFSGASKMNGEDLIFKNLTIDCSGASKIVAHVTEKIDIELSGASKFDYYGTPKVINEEISGIGKINRLD